MCRDDEDPGSYNTRRVQDMASKRSSRIYIDEEKHRDDGHQRQMASAYLSRRSSRSSLKEDAMQAPQEMEEIERMGSLGWESSTSSSSSSRSHSNSSSSGKDTPPPSNSSKAVEKTVISASSPPIAPQLSDFPFPAAIGRPANFGVVVPGVYRSSYPKPEDYGYLTDLKLKTVVTLVKKDELDHDLTSFLSSNGIQQVIFNMKGTKKQAIPMATMKSILELVLDRQNYPLLLHCNHGKHRTGCVIAAVRKLSGWDLVNVLDEYKSYAEPKIRDCDVDYISGFQCGPLESLPGLNTLHTEPASFSPVQVRTFFRTLLFSTFVMILWLVSGSHLPSTPEGIAI